MNRRTFLKAAFSGIIAWGIPPEVLAGVVNIQNAGPRSGSGGVCSNGDYLRKMENFNKSYPDDIYLDPEKYRILKAALFRLKRVQRTVGYGNFHLMSFDDSLKVARRHSRVGRFTKRELNFLEWMFYEDAALYGFYGQKPLSKISDRIQKRKVIKIPGTGNYIYKGKPYALYKKMKKDVGDQLVLTSGVRSIIKQTFLFLNKAERSRGNLSMASRSLAPPGFSYHGIGDFDVGQVGWGTANFTERFATTEVFKRLQTLGYAKLRYTPGNPLGVRFEPWHIEVDSSMV